MRVSYRQVTDADMPFLKEVYRSSREDELDLTDWDEQYKSDFIDQQFTAQHLYYQQVYNDAAFMIITVGDTDAGRLYLWESDRQIRIVDIALLSGFRNKGAGSIILQELIDKSEKSGKILSIHVEYYNRALRLYKRLGFVEKDQTGVYFYMEREPLKKQESAVPPLVN